MPLMRPGLVPALLCLGLHAAAGGCTHKVKVEPIKVEPIDITLHIYLEADEKLDDFFAYQDQPPAREGTGTGAQPQGGNP